MRTTPKKINTPHLCVALELGGSKFLLGANDEPAVPARKITIKSQGAARTYPRVREEIEKARKRFKLPPEAPVFVVYEAGFEGYWLARALTADGYDVEVIDAASVKVDRRARRTKSDLIDLKELLSLLHRRLRGEEVWRAVRIPTEEAEDHRRLTRRRDGLRKEKVSQTNRIKGLLNTQGIKLKTLCVSDDYLGTLARYDGSPLGPILLAELRDEFERLRLVRRQLAGVKRHLRTLLLQREPENKVVEVAQRLHMLKGIGPIGAFTLSAEFFAWREFTNRKQVASLAGLTDSHWKSDGIDQQQGISKAGNRRVRTTMVELAWNWIRWQPESDLAKWYETNNGNGKKRFKKVAIVAVARKLLVALWRYLDQGVVPAGAVFKEASTRTKAA